MTSGYRMAKHEFGKSIKGVAERPNEVGWQFQSIVPAIDPNAAAYADVLKILKVAHLSAAKIWVLSKTLRSAGIVLGLLVALLFVLLAIRYLDFPLLTVGMVGSALAATAVLGFVGWTIPMLHLSVFDRLFLRRGSIERV